MRLEIPIRTPQKPLIYNRMYMNGAYTFINYYKAIVDLDNILDVSHYDYYSVQHTNWIDTRPINTSMNGKLGL